MPAARTSMPAMQPPAGAKDDEGAHSIHGIAERIAPGTQTCMARSVACLSTGRWRATAKAASLQSFNIISGACARRKSDWQRQVMLDTARPPPHCNQPQRQPTVQNLASTAVCVAAWLTKSRAIVSLKPVCRTIGSCIWLASQAGAAICEVARDM